MNNTDETKEYELDPTKPLAFSIYKGVKGKFGATRFEFIPPFSNMKRKKKDGAILITASNATAPNVYDWDNKIVFALSVTDVGAFLDGIKKGNVKLYHDPGMKSDEQGQVTKGLEVTKPEDKDSFWFKLREKQGETTKEVNLPISLQEMLILDNLLRAALPKLLNW